MTAAALKVKGTPMAPYMGLMSRMSREQKLAVVAFLTESLDEPEEVRTNAELIREKYKNMRISPEIKWMIPRIPVLPEWDRQEVWNRLTDKQREDATRLNLTAEDMDERTFAIIEKHLMQYQCAKAAGCDVIVTNNKKDFH